MLLQRFDFPTVITGALLVLVVFMVGCDNDAATNITKPDKSFDPQEILNILASDLPNEEEIAKVENLTDEQMEQIRQFVGFTSDSGINDTDVEILPHQRGIKLLSHESDWKFQSIEYDRRVGNKSKYPPNQVTQDVTGKVCGGGDDYIASFLLNFSPIPSALKMTEDGSWRVRFFLAMSRKLSARVYVDGTIEMCCGKTRMNIARINSSHLKKHLRLWLK